MTETGDTRVTETGDTRVTETGDTRVTEPGDTRVTETGDTRVTETGDTRVTEPGDPRVTETGDTRHGDLRTMYAPVRLWMLLAAAVSAGLAQGGDERSMVLTRFIDDYLRFKRTSAVILYHSPTSGQWGQKQTAYKFSLK